jgi:hypothetical protein
MDTSNLQFEFIFLSFEALLCFLVTFNQIVRETRAQPEKHECMI